MQSIQKQTASQVSIITDDIFLETPSHPTACSLLAHKVHTLRAPEPSLRVRVVGINYTCQAKCSLFQPVLKMKRIHFEGTLLSKNTLQVHCFGKFFAGALFYTKIFCSFIVSKNTLKVHCFQKYVAGSLFPKILSRFIVSQNILQVYCFQKYFAGLLFPKILCGCIFSKKYCAGSLPGDLLSAPHSQH